MAFWQRLKSGRIKIYYSAGGKQQTLPKHLYAHLDNEPDHNVEAWIRGWEAKHERIAPGVEAPVITGAMKRHVEEYLAFLASRGKSPKTVADHKRMLHAYILPYFVGKNKLEDPNDWPRVSARLAAWMRDAGESEHQILKANAAIRGFWEWMADEQHVLHGVSIRVRAPIVREQETPLGRVVLPAEVLEWARRCTREDVRFMGLVGYFFSLRPQETFELRRSDFVAGTAALGTEAGRIMARHKLYGRLAVNIQRQKTQAGDVTEPKAYSRGYVACFSEQAARMVVDLLKDKEAGVDFFSYLPDWGYALWSRHGLPGISLKDLRRASIYWLGHHTDISDVMVLMKHARHRKVETTLKYLRRPEDQVADQELDLDA